MARSVAAGSRTVSDRRRALHRRRHREEAPERAQPDVSELRRLREAYFTRPQEKSTSRPAKDRIAVESSRAQNGARRRRPVDRTTEYVYATARSKDDRSALNDERPASRRSVSDDGMAAILEEEVVPGDSVSQAGGRRRRRKTLRTTLRSVTEKSESTTPRTRDSLFSSLFSKRSVVAPVPQVVDCLTCGSDDVPANRSAKLACDHRMCHSCLKRLFRLSVQDPAHMPPRCCTDQHIPLKHVEGLFDLRFKVLFNKKFDEYRTRDRVYCPNRRCGVWIRPAYYRMSGGRRWAQCNRCNTKACISCGLKLHKAQECPKDPDVAKLNEQAKREGWKRCYSCKAMVELRDGCNHMTCRCTAQFCMLCGAKWKTCDCPWFSGNAFPNIDRAGGLPDPFAFLFGQQNPPRPQRTYQEEIEQRQQQERVDADLARRMQFANLWD